LPRFEIHSHTHYSNLRLLDSINRPKNLIDRAIELGLKGIAITEHESLSSAMEVNLYAKEIAKSHPDFKIALGNEIYLCDTRDSNQRYYHFILLAKNAEGHKALRELSSRAWLNAYFDRGQHRVVTLKSDLEEILGKYPKSLIGSTACLGGELGQATLAMVDAEHIGDERTRVQSHNQIVNFLLWSKELFGDDFYIEAMPTRSKDQLVFNKRVRSIAEAFSIPIVASTDAHYLKKEDRYVHKAYLNSKGGEREVDSFYEGTYLQTDEECVEHFDGTGLDYSEMCDVSNQIYDKIERYSLEHKQTIPIVEVQDYPKNNMIFSGEKYPNLYVLVKSDNMQERYWANECIHALINKNKSAEEHTKYMERLEVEADVVRHISKELGESLFPYFNTMKHYLDMIWENGSIVGPGRGSATGFLSNYLLGITQVDPIKWGLPWWRFLNKERAELPDIDIDLAPSKRPQILQKIKEERGGELGLTLVATFGTEGTRSTILTACRGFRSEEFPDGIDSDTAQYMSSLIPSERGFLWSLQDVVYGNRDKGRNPNSNFIKEVSQFPGLLDIMVGIEGLINKRSSHASGVIMFGDDPYELGCFMRTPKGEVITQWDLHQAEAAGMTKYDYLVTEISDKIIQTIHLLEDDEVIERRPLREQYNRYLHPNVIDVTNQKLWDALGEGAVLDCFQFSTDVGLMAAKKLKPQNPLEMTDANALMRLMAERGQETPIDKHARFKQNIQLWYNEMKTYKLSARQVQLLEPYYLKSYGTPPLQEDLMMILMDKDIANFTLAEVNDARKIVWTIRK
jgi:DNA polymerase-3 subunit alpha